MTAQRIAWVTDSTAYLTQELIDHPDVYVLPLSIIIDGFPYEDGVDLTTEELYQKIRSSKEVPKTSQPAAGKFAELYESLKSNYDAAIAVHISSQLSGTIESSASGKEMADFDVKIVDSRSMSYAITTLIEQGMSMAENGVSADEIQETLNHNAKKSENYILLGSLEQFYKGGRMTGTQFLLGNLLAVKPIIQITSEGTFGLFQKVRSEKKALRRILELFSESYEKYRIRQVQILHGNVADKADALKSRVKEQFPSLDVVIGEISSSIAVHAGEGTLAMIWQNEDKDV
ncbi:DegV family protein [Salisediminibacterium halotolerans]|uniref:DegV family protein n=1 Tax=Salisediminibacterium halotolerans TaxID=517425 RepID=UPI000EAFE37A|nr:DegV family protein [Salisediminibacterium halotolerans]RLJ74406.1 DegV family protein with EDD domain [Actinophytocola xinjiangensis]RPE87501.1 DegV family protein with EDD domain [Salisediminibacterium halotolerans]TWG35243.1 DegV family protein with EDD domain [Salisediminibacterium halotolerans]GEL06723.1 hypothetical protein SHA02_01390 [Salisediminibacterium halotolerans]